MADVHIRQLGPSDAAAFQGLRLRGLRECPEAFGSTYDEDQAVPLETVAERLTGARTPVGRAVFGAFDGKDLVGVTGCMQQAKTKARHTAIVWGMYVSPEQRGRGLGRRLLEAIIIEAGNWPAVERLTLTVVERAVAARHLYRAMGFDPFGREPDGLRQDGIRDTVEHLTFTLRRADESVSPARQLR
jgi:GNAT superfamily N-acetyltransferase